MKKLFYALLLIFGVSSIISCQKMDDESKENGEVSIIGEWISFNLDELNEFATGITYREASTDMKVVFTKDGMATFTYDGGSGSYPSYFEGRYELLEEDGVKFLDFPEGLYDKNGEEYGISSAFDSLDGGSLTIRFSKQSWDWYEQWYFSKVE